MEILLKIKEGKIQIINNNVFISRKSVEITLYPIPPFLKEAKCECGNSAQFVFGDMSCICSKCVNKYFTRTVLKKEQDISIPITENSIKRLGFEWSVNGERWYNISGRNIKPKDWKRFLSEIRKSIINGTHANFNGEYDKDNKEMTIF